MVRTEPDYARRRPTGLDLPGAAYTLAPGCLATKTVLAREHSDRKFPTTHGGSQIKGLSARGTDKGNHGQLIACVPILPEHEWCAPGAYVKAVGRYMSTVYRVLTPPFTPMGGRTCVAAQAVWNEYTGLSMSGSVYNFFTDDLAPADHMEWQNPPRPTTTTVPGLGTYDSEALKARLATLPTVED